MNKLLIITVLIIVLSYGVESGLIPEEYHNTIKEIGDSAVKGSWGFLEKAFDIVKGVIGKDEFRHSIFAAAEFYGKTVERVGEIVGEEKLKKSRSALEDVVFGLTNATETFLFN